VGNNDKFQYQVQLILQQQQAQITPEVIELLAEIKQSGSLLLATQHCHFSYNKAWRLIKQVEHEIHTPLVHSVNGGANGGGTHLTETGILILKKYISFQKKVTPLVEQCFQEVFATGESNNHE
jgi:molybdate transport system regulatory protein